MEYYFDRDDRLERLKYAEFLKTLLINCDKYRREDSDGAYVIALDSPWGTGKTRFVKMLRNFLEDRTSEAEKNRPVGKDNEPLPPGAKAEFNVVYYNSWETDYWNDALEPLICSIRDARVLEVEGAEADNEKIKNTIVKILKGMGIALVKLALGDACGSVFQGALDGLNDVQSDPLEDYKARMELYTDFRKALGRVIAFTKKKLVIIVDELDRCRPTFAIQTLELAKHLFAVPNLVFIFSLDIKQLSFSVETIYGQNMDAPGYLCRFFDYISKIPNPDRKAFIKECLIKSDPGLSIEKSISCERKKRESSDIFIEFVNELAEENALSFRDITTVFASFHIMLISWLGEYRCLPVYELYFLFLLIKYKKAKDFNSILSQSEIENIQNYVHSNIHSPINSILEKQLAFLASKVPICDMSLTAYQINQTGSEILARNGLYPQIHSTANDAKYNYSSCQVPLHIIDILVADIVSSGSDITFDHFLYINDFKNWHKIKDLTPAQYLSRQLEMFDFVLPAGEAKAGR